MKSSSKTQELLISSHLILAFTLQIPLARFSSFWHFNRSKACCGSDIFLLSSVQFSSVAQSCQTLCDPMDYSTPGLPVHHQLPEFTQIHVHWVGDAIQPSYPLLPLLLLPSIFPSIRVFSNESVLRIRWPKYWNFSFSTSPSSEYTGLL